MLRYQRKSLIVTAAVLACSAMFVLATDRLLRTDSAEIEEVKFGSVVREIDGGAYLYFELGRAVYEQRQMSLFPVSLYELFLDDDGNSVYVSFVDRNETDSGGDGNIANVPEFVVEIEKGTFRVLSAHFVRKHNIWPTSTVDPDHKEVVEQ